MSAVERQSTFLVDGQRSEQQLVFDHFRLAVVKGGAVQTTLVAGAEAIQRAFDFQHWAELQVTTAPYAVHVAEGDLQGSPANSLLQIVRGDGWAVNSGQWFTIQTGNLASRTAVVRVDNDNRFDLGSGEICGFVRHVLPALAYRPLLPTDIRGHIAHCARIQVADYFSDRGTSVLDPDDPCGTFLGDIFQFPIPGALLDALPSDPHLCP